MSEIRTNADRARRALEAVERYKERDWRDLDPTEGLLGAEGEELIIEAIGDLLCDLHHLADTLVLAVAARELAAVASGRDLVWDALIDRGAMHYEAEAADEAEEATRG